MNKTSRTSKNAADKLVKDIRRMTRQCYSAEEKSASFWQFCGASKASQCCAAAKVSPKASLQKQLAVRAQNVAMSARVTSVMAELLPVGLASAEDVCRAIGISRSTMQRRLKAEGTVFQSLLYKSCLDIAIRQMVNSRLRAYEIAFHTGYHNANSFSRSFQRWTGLSPLEFRDRHRKNG